MLVSIFVLILPLSAVTFGLHREHPSSQRDTILDSFHFVAFAVLQILPGTRAPPCSHPHCSGPHTFCQ